MDIEHWRHEIDELDEELLRLLNMRARLAMKVGALKRSAGLPLRDHEREQFVLRHLQELNDGPLDQKAVIRLFRRIIYESRRIESIIADRTKPPAVASVNSPTKLRGIA